MTIAENLFLGRELRKPGLLGRLLRMLDKRKMLAEAIGAHEGPEDRHPLDDAGRSRRSPAASARAWRWRAARPSRGMW